jgi:hypothetical protein
VLLWKAEIVVVVEMVVVKVVLLLKVAVLKVAHLGMTKTLRVVLKDALAEVIVTLEVVLRIARLKQMILNLEMVRLAPINLKAVKAVQSFLVLNGINLSRN